MSLPSEPYRPMPATQASLILRAAGCERDALQDLLTAYLPALRSHLRFSRRWRGRVPESDIEDVVQDFAASKLLQSRLLGSWDTGRRFRNLLLTSLDHFLIDRSRKRGLDTTGLDHADQAVSLEPTPGQAADDAAVVGLMGELIERAVSAMRLQYADGPQAGVLVVLEGRLLGPMLRDEPPVPYEELVRQTGAASVASASNLLVTAKRAFRRHLAEACADLGDDAAELAEQLQRAAAR